MGAIEGILIKFLLEMYGIEALLIVAVAFLFYRQKGILNKISVKEGEFKGCIKRVEEKQERNYGMLNRVDGKLDVIIETGIKKNGD